jgi:hypothetical protein
MPDENFSREEVEEIVDERIQEQTSPLKNKWLVGAASVLVIGLVAFPALGDINIKDSGDLVLHGSTGLNMTNSPIRELDVGGADSAVTKSWVQNKLTSSGGEWWNNPAQGNVDMGGYMLDNISYDNFEWSDQDGDEVATRGYVHSNTLQQINVKRFEGPTTISSEWGYCSLSTENYENSKCEVYRQSSNNWKLEEPGGNDQCAAMCMQFEGVLTQHGDFIQNLNVKTYTGFETNKWEDLTGDFPKYTESQVDYEVKLGEKVKRDSNFNYKLEFQDSSSGSPHEVVKNVENQNDDATFKIKDISVEEDSSGDVKSIKFRLRAEAPGTMNGWGGSRKYKLLNDFTDPIKIELDYEGNKN